MQGKRRFLSHLLQRLGCCNFSFTRYMCMSLVFACIFFCLLGNKYGLLTASLSVLFFWLIWALNILQYFFRFMTVIGNEVDYHDMLRRADIMYQPNIQKTTVFDENAWLSYGFSCMQGWRRSMEDDHITLLTEDGGFFGVFDGHSGVNVAKFCGENIFDFVSKTVAFKEKNYSRAIYDGFIAIDKYLHSKDCNERSGCTASVLFVKEDNLYCGNAGDSRSVLCRDGESVPLSNDHKPFLPCEQSRIERAGGFVWNRRVNGALALSRAIGDFSFKRNTQLSWDQQAVTSAPEVRFSRLNRDHDEFVVIACDGIWDVLSNEKVVEFVRMRIQSQVPLHKIAEQLIEQCLSPRPFGLGCDNMSVIIVQFKRSVPSLCSGKGTASLQGVGNKDFALGTDEQLNTTFGNKKSESNILSGGFTSNSSTQKDGEKKSGTENDEKKKKG